MALTAFLGRKHGPGHGDSPHLTPSTVLVCLGPGKPVIRGGWSRAGVFSSAIPKWLGWFEHWAPSVVSPARKRQWIVEV